jgi:4-hydroxyacetophenone monooxygenase
MRQEMDRDRLKSALASADLRVLLMVLFHFTGDRKWLSAPYQPQRDITIIADRNAGFDAMRQQEIRAAALEILSGGAKPAIGDPGNALMVEMMSTCLGENVPPEYAGMMREEVGFISRFADWKKPAEAKRRLAARRFRVGIVGAGSSGIILARNLDLAGIDYIVFERNEEVGGTWYRHRYPGCGVDTPNHAYSFSFGSRYAWTRYFAPREQLQDYMQKIADETGIRSRTLFGTTVRQATWREAEKRWSVEVEAADGPATYELDVLVSAIGQLSDPYRMPIRGEESFTGKLFHPIDWPEGLDVTGKKVAVVGTGATAMQIVPAIAPDVEQLTIYQRTPQWARPIPRYHDPISADEQWLLSSVPFYAEWFRFSMLWRYGDGLLPTLRKDPEWPHPSQSVNRVNERHRLEMLAHIERELADRPDLLPKAVPQYPAYGKRILLDAGWFRAIKRPNVELVTERIDHIDGSAVVATDGTRREADIVVVSTGYKVNELTARLDVSGRDGVKLADVWGDDNPFAYLGCTVPGFPNLFIIYGPNTGLAHGGSAIFMNECAARYVADWVVRMVEDDLATVEVKSEVAAAYTARVDAEHEALVWTAPGLDSYYRNSKGRVTSANPWRLVDYWSMTHQADAENYVVEKRQPARAKKTG